MKKTIGCGQLSALQKIILILGLVLSLIVCSIVFSMLEAVVKFPFGSYAIWIIGILEGWFILRRYILEYHFELEGFILRVYRSYGKRKRAAGDILLRGFQYIGEPGEARKRFPDAAVTRYAHSACKLPVTAVVLKNKDSLCRLEIQADEDLKNEFEKLRKAEKR